LDWSNDLKLGATGVAHRFHSGRRRSPSASRSTASYSAASTQAGAGIRSASLLQREWLVIVSNLPPRKRRTMGVEVVRLAAARWRTDHECCGRRHCNNTELHDNHALPLMSNATTRTATFGQTLSSKAERERHRLKAAGMRISERLRGGDTACDSIGATVLSGRQRASSLAAAGALPGRHLMKSGHRQVGTWGCDSTTVDSRMRAVREAARCTTAAVLSPAWCASGYRGVSWSPRLCRESPDRELSSRSAVSPLDQHAMVSVL